MRPPRPRPDPDPLLPLRAQGPPARGASVSDTDEDAWGQFCGSCRLSEGQVQKHVLQSRWLFREPRAAIRLFKKQMGNRQTNCRPRQTPAVRLRRARAPPCSPHTPVRPPPPPRAGPPRATRHPTDRVVSKWSFPRRPAVMGVSATVWPPADSVLPWPGPLACPAPPWPALPLPPRPAPRGPGPALSRRIRRSGSGFHRASHQGEGGGQGRRSPSPRIGCWGAWGQSWNKREWGEDPRGGRGQARRGAALVRWSVLAPVHCSLVLSSVCQSCERKVKR